MPKLRLAIILPILIVCLDFPVALWQRHVDGQQPPKHEYPIVSPLTLAYLGLNAPAVVFKGVCVTTLPIYRIDHAPPTLLGIAAGEILFFTGVVLLWFAVGLFLDRRSGQLQRQTATTVWRVLGTLLLLAFGVWLLGGGAFLLRQRPTGNPIGDVLQGILWFGWSAVFVIASAMRHLTVFSWKAVPKPH